MNDQQLAAVKQAMEALESERDKYLEWGDKDGAPEDVYEAITALQSIISQDALYKMAEDAVTIGLSYNDWPKIGCVNHDCDQCRGAQEPVEVDAEGENMAVRFFLMLYGQPGLTVGQMKGHMRMSGFKMWPAWVDTEPDGAHLTKAGAQLWIRHLFALEPTAPQPVPVKTYHDGKPWPVAPKPWVGLTDEEIYAIGKELGLKCRLGGNPNIDLDYARAIEAKLKEKNT
jgi:hypothetical protein